MTPLYADAPVEIRSDLLEAHRETVNEWARPGNWWSAAERLAIANEVRAARAADELPPWVAPTTVDGLIDTDHPLPSAAIDAVWRLTNHSATVTSDWHRQILERGMSAEQYVELVAVVATAACLETFSLALGMGSVPLPGPAEGEPNRVSVPEAAVSTHWVPTVPMRGANVGKALTAVPVAALAWRRLSDAQYVPAEALLGDLSYSRGALDRMQIELVAARTSLLNECFY